MKRTAAVITISDKGSKGERVDTSGPAISNMLEAADYEVKYYKIIPDEMEEIKAELIKCADDLKIQLILTTGGTGFSPRDVTPEATLAVIERETRGIPEAMRSESMRITPRGCLSRSAAGIRGGSLIINLPGSEKAAKENLNAVLGAIDHGLDILASAGSADCAAVPATKKEVLSAFAVKNEVLPELDMKKEVPSVDVWMKEAKADPDASKVGMYLMHNGVVRETSKAKVRNNATDTNPVTGMVFFYDAAKVAEAIDTVKKMDGIYYVRVWLAEGELQVGDDIMYVLIGGDIRPRVMDALDFLVSEIKSECVKEIELFE